MRGRPLPRRMFREAAAVAALGVLLLAGAGAFGAAPPAGHPVRSGDRVRATPAEVARPHLLDPASTTGATARLVVATTDPSAMPNAGLRTNITAFSSSTLPADTSLQVSVTETIGGFDAVFGVFLNNVLPPTAFFSVFNNSTDATVHLGYWTDLALLDGVSYDFQLLPVSGTDWELTVNGAEFNSTGPAAFFDFGAAQATWLDGLLFTEIAFYTTTSPNSTGSDHPGRLRGAERLGVVPAESATTNFSGSGGSPWGVEGRDQHPTLAPGELDTGTSVPPLVNGTSLWSGGPVPVHVVLAVSSGSGVAMTPLALSVLVDNTTGAPIPGVGVYVGDSLGGFSIMDLLITNRTGGWTTPWSCPNVSSAQSDLVTASVTLLGYQGSEGEAVMVTPAQRLVPLHVRPPGGIEFTGCPGLLHRGGGGHGGTPFPGAALVLSTATAGSRDAPAEAVTGEGGTVGATLLAPPAPTELVVMVNVTGGGAWGHATFTVAVRTPPPSFWSAHAGQIEGGAAAAVVVAILAVVVWRVARRPRRPLPPSHGIRWATRHGPPNAGTRPHPLPVGRLEQVLLEPQETLVPEVEMPGARLFPVGPALPSDVLEGDVDPLRALLEPDVNVGLWLGVVEERRQRGRRVPGELDVHVGGHPG